MKESVNLKVSQCSSSFFSYHKNARGDIGQDLLACIQFCSPCVLTPYPTSPKMSTDQGPLSCHLVKGRDMSPEKLEQQQSKGQERNKAQPLGFSVFVTFFVALIFLLFSSPIRVDSGLPWWQLTPVSQLHSLKEPQ